MVRRCVVVTALLLSLPALAGARGDASTRLTINVFPSGTASSVVRIYTLRCNPTGGTAPRPLRACRALARLATPFAPVPPHTLCAQISGGAQEAVVKGVLRGRRVDARLNLRGSCEIERWRRLSRVVPGFPSSA